jgi:hypothetical protein
MDRDNYSFNEHIHRYAVWTAARAVQRNFTNTKNIWNAIDQTSLKFFTDEHINSDVSFDKFHQITCHGIMDYLKDKAETSYGRAAKIVAIYLKTSVVIRNDEAGLFSNIIHPPIDRILLNCIRTNHPQINLPKINWTKLDESDYFELIKQLRTLNYVPFWKIEVNWQPNQDY